MNDLVQFLNDRLAEDEAAATEAGSDEWSSDDAVWMLMDSKGEAVVHNEGKPTEEQAIHMARHDPARVLREVAAKRALLQRYASAARSAEVAYANDSDVYFAEGLEQSIGIMAAAYSDHSEYDPEWTVS